MKRLPWELGFFFVLVAVFSLTYGVTYIAISQTPYGHITQPTYYSAKPPLSNESATNGGAWQNQMLSISPQAGATEVSRDVVILIVDPRPVNVENLTLSPNMSTKIWVQHYFESETLYVHPAELLQPNTTYNVSATVAGTPSWWTFSTSAEPAKYTTYPSGLLNSTPAFLATIAALIVFAVGVQKKKKIFIA